ncbi:MAG TPA: hypothetical protein ENL07_09415 [Chlorobaculum parvum]|uniref:Uncharacterized protein n=1 Tax=Chlorobaculum parvum TaxID=274539 RepID=A0A7C5DFB2_9CHLB|nr:hypothetical protein [Chlorobaculum parvum]
MALIQTGAIDRFAVTAKKQAIESFTPLKGISTFSELSELSRTSTPKSFEYTQSPEPRGLALKNIKLTEGFNGFLGNVFSSKNNVYFVAWAWDLSGEPICQYPGADADPNSVIIPMRVGKVREFIGEGINLFPKRTITGGMAIRIQLWESDEETRKFGKAMTETAEAINNSSLSSLISAIALAGPSAGALTLIKNATVKLGNDIGTILKSNGDDYVDFFEGYYPSDKVWTAEHEAHSGNSSVITLAKY